MGGGSYDYIASSTRSRSYHLGCRGCEFESRLLYLFFFKVIKKNTSAIIYLITIWFVIQYSVYSSLAQLV